MGDRDQGMYNCYPPLKINEVYKIPVTEVHQIYVEESGSPYGIPVVVVHGGPGGFAEPMHRRLFDPERYRIILFDQRGCGQSAPLSTLEANTTQDILADMEIIRETLNIERWVVSGGGWGSLLSLLYAEQYPQHSIALLLWSIFLGRSKDVAWFFGDGTRRIFPDYWEAFVAPIPEEERHNILEAYYNRLTGHDDFVRRIAAKAWASWEGRAATLEPQQKRIDHFTEPPHANSLARIGCHYLRQNCFLEENQVLLAIARLANVPGTIIHGRYDMVCLLENAWELHKLWPNSTLKIIRDAGHAMTEAPIIDAIVHSSDELAHTSRG